MAKVFRVVLEMSITGTWVILAVLLARMLLRRFPKSYCTVLWAVAGFRLCCPVSFKAVFSLFRVPHVQTGSVVTQIGIPEPHSVVMGTREGFGAPLPVPSAVPSSGPDWMEILAIVWLAGVVLLLLWGVVCDVRLRMRLRTAVRLRENIYQSEQVRSPFILGVFRSKIYLPFGLDGDQEHYVLAHERCHLKRFDPAVKLLAYLILTLHWFNPLCHLAFHLLGEDMEMGCDEAVLKERADRYDYSAALVSVAAERRVPAPSPLAFGETAVKARVKNILRWKPAKAWTVVLAVVMCVLVGLACAADPVGEQSPKEGKYIIANGQTGEDYLLSDMVEIRDDRLILANEIYDLSGKTWERPPFDTAQWEEMLACLVGAAPETLDECQYMELFVLSNETKDQYNDQVDRGRAISKLYENVENMGNATCTVFLLRQGNALYVCHDYRDEPRHMELPSRRFLSDRLVQCGGELDPTVQTFAQLDGLLDQVLAQPGTDVAAKVTANQELYRTILRHNHIQYYLCHVMQTEGLDDDKGELVGILFEGVLLRKFEEPLIQRGDLTAAQYFERYMAYAEEYYKDYRMYYAAQNASGPMLYYLQAYYDYGK